MGKLARRNERSARRTAERLTEEEVGELAEMVEEIGVLERRVVHARSRLDAYVLDLETKYNLRAGDNLNTDTGAITRRTGAGPAPA